MLPAALGAGAKRVLDLIADWPWIGRRDLAGLAGVSGQRVSQLLAPAGEAGLVTREAGLLALSDRGLALLARRDRSAVNLALARWSAAPVTRRRRSPGATSPAGAAASCCATSSTPPPCTASRRRWRHRRAARDGRWRSSTRPTGRRGSSATTTACTPSTPTPSASSAGKGSRGRSSWSGSAAPCGPPPWRRASRPTCATTPRRAPPTTTGPARRARGLRGRTRRPPLPARRPQGGGPRPSGRVAVRLPPRGAGARRAAGSGLADGGRRRTFASLGPIRLRTARPAGHSAGGREIQILPPPLVTTDREAPRSIEGPPAAGVERHIYVTLPGCRRSSTTRPRGVTNPLLSMWNDLGDRGTSATWRRSLI